ncbi:MAG TPA: RNA polymerase sigma-70 factor [Flavisolibacter sp.]|nr:RNA polymerase sigma-70 factor [Flavisolibacter sp.]
MTSAAYLADHQKLMGIPEDRLIERLGNRDEVAFEQVFKQHYKGLHAYAFTLIKDDDIAEEIVQNVFYKLWERSEGLTITSTVAAYLYRAVHNESLNHLKHLRVRTQHQLYVSYRMDAHADTTFKKLQLKELEKRLHAALAELPEGCRTVFQLSRFEELRYGEIAETLGISIKTVENQMGKALKLLRSKLVDFLSILIILLNFLNRHL